MTINRRVTLSDLRWVIFFLVIFLLFYAFKGILAPFLSAAVLAYIANPLVDHVAKWRLGKFGLNRTLATALVLMFLSGLLITILLIVVPLLEKEVLLVIARMPSYLETIRATIDPWLLEHFGISLKLSFATLQQNMSGHWQTAGGYASNLLSSVSTHGVALLGLITTTLLVPIVLFFLLRDWHLMIAKISELIPGRWLNKATEITNEVDQVLAEFLRGQLSVMLLMSAYYAIGLLLVGLDLALPIGLVAGLLGFVPYLGIATGITLATLAAALQFSSVNGLIPVFVVFGIGQGLEGFLLTPWLVGDRIGLHPVMVIFALLAGGQLFGFAGILLALPVSAALAVGLRHAKIAYLQSEFYQR